MARNHKLYYNRRWKRPSEYVLLYNCASFKSSKGAKVKINLEISKMIIYILFYCILYFIANHVNGLRSLHCIKLTDVIFELLVNNCRDLIQTAKHLKLLQDTKDILLTDWEIWTIYTYLTLYLNMYNASFRFVFISGRSLLTR